MQSLEQQINMLIVECKESLRFRLAPVEQWGWDAETAMMVERDGVVVNDKQFEQALEQALEGDLVGLYRAIDWMILETPLELCLLSASEYIRHRRVYKINQ